MPWLPATEPGVLIRTPAGRITFWSEELHRRYGFSPDEALGHDAHALLRTHHFQPHTQIDAILAARSEWHGGLIAYCANDQPTIVANHWFLHQAPDPLGALVTEIHADIADLGTPAQALADVVATFAGDLSQPLTVLGCLLDNAQRAAQFVWPSQDLLGRLLADATTQLDRAGGILARVRAVGQTLRDPQPATMAVERAPALSHPALGHHDAMPRPGWDPPGDGAADPERGAATRQRAKALHEARHRLKQSHQILSERALALQSIQVYRRRLDALRAEPPAPQTEQVLRQLLGEEVAKLTALLEQPTT